MQHYSYISIASLLQVSDCHKETLRGMLLIFPISGGQYAVTEIALIYEYMNCSCEGFSPSLVEP